MKKFHYYLIIIYLFIFLMYLLLETNKEGFDNNDIILVISRYNEDLEWLKIEPFSKLDNIIYNKGDNDDFFHNENTKKVVKLPNVGRCDHTYLYYIINNYGDLKNVVVFVPGSLNMEWKNQKATKIIKELYNNENIVKNDCSHFNDVKTDLYDFQLENWKATDIKNSSINPETKLELSKIRPFGKWYESHFGDIRISNVFFSGILTVDKYAILQHPKSFYENLIVELENSSNPEVGHYFERSWAVIFYPKNNDICL